MSNPALSQRLFNEGLQLKREGRYFAAVEKYKESMRAYPEDPEMPSVILALAKSLYLSKKYGEAYQWYIIWTGIQVSASDGAILEDYKIYKSQTTKTSAQARLHSFLLNPARHLGHVLLDDPNQNDAKTLLQVQSFINEYIKSLSGQQNAKMNNAYEEKCQNAGYQAMENILDMYLRGKLRVNDLPELFWKALDGRIHLSDLPGLMFDFRHE